MADQPKSDMDTTVDDLTLCCLLRGGEEAGRLCIEEGDSIYQELKYVCMKLYLTIAILFKSIHVYICFYIYVTNHEKLNETRVNFITKVFDVID